MQIYQEEEIRQKVALDQQALLAIKEAFVKLSQGEVVMPDVMHIDIKEHQGEVDVKSAYIQGMEKFAIKQSSGFFNNPKKGLPSSGGLMIVIDSTTGFPCAILLDNGYLTDIRTALAGAVGAKYLAPNNIKKVGLIGTGNQARLQLQALKLVRNYNHVVIYARDSHKSQEFAKEMSIKLACETTVVQSVAQVVKAVDTLITTTPSREALIMADDLHPGLHITAMGADAPYKNEIDPFAFNYFDYIICDDIGQSLRIGESRSANEKGLYKTNSEKILTLGEVIQNPELSKKAQIQTTLCDLTGVGAQDTAIANYALKRLDSK